MAEKKPQIVIKKITVVSGGAHGGAWKVAFADFMTAMMAFFLVMWLVNQTDPAQKKAISDYFSTPSVIEYQFSNYGVELTLEKLFIDLVNEPLKVFQSFVTPVDRTPNVMAMGQKKVVAAHLTTQLGEAVGDIDVTADSVVFEIPDHLLFEKGSASPTGQFVEILEKVKGVTTGLEDSDIQITSVVSVASVKNRDPVSAKTVSEERLDLFNNKVKSSLESDSVDVSGRALVRSGERPSGDRKASDGYIRVEIKKKKILPEVRNPQSIQESSFGEAQSSKSVYDNFVNQVSKQKRKEPESEKR